MSLSSPKLAMVEPAYANFPHYLESLGPEVCDLAAMAGMPPDPEQELALNALFALDPVRKTREGVPASAAFEFCVICARQNLKTGFMKQAALGYLFITDQPLVVWSAHEMNTTKEAFRDITILIENTPQLRKRLKPGPSQGIMRGNGDEAIELAPTPECPAGQRLKFKARTHGGGRGLTGNKVFLDEGFALEPSHMGSLLPTLSAVPDPQVIIGSSAGLAKSEYLRSVRDRGRAQSSPRLAYLEFCAPEDVCEAEKCTHALGTPGCACDDMAYVRMANPALERRITVEYIEDERQSLPPEEFARERLGWWDKPDVEEGPLISSDQWTALTDTTSAPVDPVSFGVYVNKMQTNAAIAVAAYRADGLIHVGIIPAVHGKAVDSLPGTAWIPSRVWELAAKWKPCATVIDNASSAASLITEIEEADKKREHSPGGVEILTTSAGDMARACQNFYARTVTDQVLKADGRPGSIRHTGAGPLMTSVLSGKKRDLADAWAWDRKDASSDITQLVAVTLALHGLIEKGRPPKTEVWEPFWT